MWVTTKRYDSSKTLITTLLLILIASDNDILWHLILYTAFFLWARRGSGWCVIACGNNAVLVCYNEAVWQKRDYTKEISEEKQGNIHDRNSKKETTPKLNWDEATD